MRAAKSGFVEVLLDWRFPTVVVMSVSSWPMSPVALGSSAGSMGIPSSALILFISAVASDIFLAAASMSS